MITDEERAEQLEKENIELQKRVEELEKLIEQYNDFSWSPSAT